MTIDFNNITEDVIPMNEFRLKHRGTNGNYEKLPDSHFKQFKPLGKKGSHFLWNYTLKSDFGSNADVKIIEMNQEFLIA